MMVVDSEDIVVKRELEVCAGDDVYVVDTKEFDNDDVLAMLPDSALMQPPSGGGGRGVEHARLHEHRPGALAAGGQFSAGNAARS
eukprot:jgi/Tetstr1/433051/TSEL_022386.t1